MGDWALSEDHQAGLAGQQACKKGLWEQDRYIACPHSSLTIQARAPTWPFSLSRDWYMTCYHPHLVTRTLILFSRPATISAWKIHSCMHSVSLQSAWVPACHPHTSTISCTANIRVPTPFNRSLIMFAWNDHAHMNSIPLQLAHLFAILACSLPDLCPLPL